MYLGIIGRIGFIRNIHNIRGIGGITGIRGFGRFTGSSEAYSGYILVFDFKYPQCAGGGG